MRASSQMNGFLAAAASLVRSVQVGTVYTRGNDHTDSHKKNHEVQTEIFPMFTSVKVLDHRGHFIPGSQVAEQLD